MDSKHEADLGNESTENAESLSETPGKRRSLRVPHDSDAPSGSLRAPVPQSALMRWLMSPIALIKWLYVLVLASADRKSGPTVLGVVSFAEASFFPIPQDPLFIALCLGNPKKSYWFGTITTVTSVLGGIFGWVLGYYFFAEVVEWAVNGMGWAEAWFGTPAGGNPLEAAGNTFYEGSHMHTMKGYFDGYGFFAVVVAALTPVPYKVATVASGVFELSLMELIIGSIIGRGLRFYTYSTIFYFYGDWARRVIELYFTPLSILGAILMVGGFAVLKLI